MARLSSEGWKRLVMMSAGGFVQHVFVYMFSHFPLLLCILCVLYHSPYSRDLVNRYFLSSYLGFA